MKEINSSSPISKRKLQGSFTVEFAIIAVVFSLMLAFTGDIVSKLSMRGKLDRLSFSAVGLLKERTQLYDSVDELNQEDVDKVHQLIKHSLRRTTASFDEQRLSAYVEEQLYNGTTPLPVRFYVPGTVAGQTAVATCLPSQSLDQRQQQLGVVTSWGRNARLYRVTLCYETGSWFGDLTGSDQYRYVASTAVIVGR
ncbi:tight adherence pilus pseudopilin TadF [Ferrimonas pelagia]|uniref:Tight adherence pilus pseudopilin TadF n=1 Tax=Ferrimonas pelagia TaxID=1177826 RepID=A0ABP9FGP9_9GAMM